MTQTIQEVMGRTLRLRGPHCIIVGPNGTGKSTALQVLAYALGRQWKGAASLGFERIEVEFEDSQTAILTREACSIKTRRVGRLVRSSRIDRLLSDSVELEQFSTADLDQIGVAEHYSVMLRLSAPDLRAVQQSFRKTSGEKLRQKADREIGEFASILDKQSVPITLYLPTYRRTELELVRLLEGLPEYTKSEIIGAQTQTGLSTDFIIELIKFGMEDVSNALQQFERQTRDFARNRFNRMMTSYLKEMANSTVLSVGDLRSHRIDAQTIDIVLSRIEEGLLSAAEKQQISDIILELSSGPGAGNQPFNKKWLAHFFVRLLEVNHDIEGEEGKIREFAKILAKYFVPKQVSYDIENYHCSIKESSGEELKLSDLSSGEKQLVSIMSQLYLQSGGKKLNVLIDEPELSLSVPWQTDLLPDVAGTSSCNQLFAVTHSPFVYDNSMSEMVVDFLPVASPRG